MKELNIIYEDANLLAINKPPGIKVHGDGRSDEETIVDGLLAQYPEVKDVGEKNAPSWNTLPVRPGIVHRLDRDTSGVLLISKNQETFLYYKDLFQKRLITKTYRAFVYGIMKESTGVIDSPIGRSRRDFRKWSAGEGARRVRREARTEFKVLERLIDTEATFVELHPETGRTHQIRVHLLSIGHPVVCDTLYANKRPCILGFSRHALHAYAIEFSTAEGTRLRIEAPLPEDFMQVLC